MSQPHVHAYTLTLHFEGISRPLQSRNFTGTLHEANSELTDMWNNSYAPNQGDQHKAVLTRDHDGQVVTEIGGWDCDDEDDEEK